MIQAQLSKRSSTVTFKEPSPDASQGSPMHQSPLNSPEITVVSETPAPISISDDNEDDPTNTEVPETQPEQTAPATGDASPSDENSVLDDFNTVHVISPLSQQDSQAAPESFTQGSPMDLGFLKMLTKYTFPHSLQTH